MLRSNDIMHVPQEFGEIDWSKLSSDSFLNWRAELGEIYGLRDTSWVIVIQQGRSTHIYPMPEPLNHLIAYIQRSSKEELKRMLRDLLGVKDVDDQRTTRGSG